MHSLQVLRYPHPLLRRKSKPVVEFGEDLEQLAQSMLELMYEEHGVGLAAPQVGQLRQLIVMDVHAGDEEREDRDPRIVVNPQILERHGEMVTEEGCLSVPDFTAEVTRAERIVVVYRTPQGEERREELTELEAVCLQHEIDHLSGKLFIDYLPPLKRQIVKKRLVKQAQSA